MSDSERGREFTSDGGVTDETTRRRHDAIVANISALRLALATGEGPLATAAKRVEEHVVSGKCLLYVAETPDLADLAIAVCLVFPEDDTDKFIPAVVVNGREELLARDPTHWPRSTLDQVIQSLANLDAAYKMSSSVAGEHMLSAEEFYSTLERVGVDEQRFWNFNDFADSLRHGQTASVRSRIRPPRR